MIPRGSGTFALRSHHGRYLVAEKGGQLNANRSKIGPWERFRVVSVNAERRPPPPVTKSRAGSPKRLNNRVAPTLVSALRTSCQKSTPASFGIEFQPKYPTPPDGDPTKVLLPNRRAYVTNEDACPCLGRRCTRDTIQYRAAITRVTGRWSGFLTATPIGRSALKSPVSFRVSNRQAAACLPRGKYRLELLINRGSTQRPKCVSGRRTDTLDAFIIAVLGDSYSAGEGTPAGRIVGRLTKATRPKLNKYLRKVYPVRDALDQFVMGSISTPVWAKADPGPVPTREDTAKALMHRFVPPWTSLRSEMPKVLRGAHDDARILKDMNRSTPAVRLRGVCDFLVVHQGLLGPRGTAPSERRRLSRDGAGPCRYGGRPKAQPPGCAG